MSTALAQQPEPVLFGQSIIKAAMADMGGRVSTAQLGEYLKTHYPGHSITKTYYRALSALVKHGEIKKVRLGKGLYSIKFVYVLVAE